MLERNWYAVLATTRPDGRPHAAPVAFVVHDRRIWMASVAGAVRLRNIAHVPFASVVVSEGQGEHHVAVMIEGRATLHEAEPVVSAWLGAAWRERFGTTPDWAGTVIELAPDRLLSFGRRISNGA